MANVNKTAKGAPQKPQKTEPTQHALGFSLDLPASPPDVGVYDSAYGKLCFEALATTIDAVPPEQLVSTRTDIQRAGQRVLSLASAAFAQPMRSRLGALPKDEFDIVQIHRLAPYGSVLLYILEEAKAAGVFAAEAKISADLDKASAEVEKRMQGLLEYRYEDDSQLGRTLKDLAPGTGYRDRANDLLGYARLYGLKAEEVATDTAKYRKTDAADARRYAGQIFAELGAAQSPAARAWSVRLSKVFALLFPVHADVRVTLLWLLRKDPSAADRFPTLYATGARKTPRKPAAGGGQGDPGGLPGPA